MANANVIHTQDWNLTGSTGITSTNFLRGDGTWADPIGILPAYSNVVFIAKNGDDTTGLAAFTAASDKGVLAYPFLTIAAARSAVSGAGTASATNRWLGKIMGGGTWTEQLVLLNYMDWDLGNAIIDLQAGALYTIDDNNVSCDSIIYGNAQILRSTAGTLGCIRTQNASTVLTVYANKISSSIGSTIVCTNGIQVINSNIVSTSTSSCITCAAGTQTINGNLTAVTAASSAVISCSGTGTQTIYGNIIGSSGGAALISAGTQTVHGNLSSAGDDCAECGGTGTQLINGNCSSTTHHGAKCTGGTQTINGNVSSSAVAGSQVQAGTQTINGDVSHTGTTLGMSGATTSSTGVQNITGNISTDDTTGIAPAISYSSSGLSTYSGTISALAEAINLASSGTIIIKPGSRIVTTGTNENAIEKDGGTLILDGVTLIATGTGKSILATGAETVKIYGTCVANADVEATDVTLQGGEFIVDPTAVYGVSVGTIIT